MPTIPVPLLKLLVIETSRGPVLRSSRLLPVQLLARVHVERQIAEPAARIDDHDGPDIGLLVHVAGFLIDAEDAGEPVAAVGEIHRCGAALDGDRAADDALHHLDRGLADAGRRIHDRRSPVGPRHGDQQTALGFHEDRQRQIGRQIVGLRENRGRNETQKPSHYEERMLHVRYPSSGPTKEQTSRKTGLKD